MKWNEGALANLSSADIMKKYVSLAQQPGKVARNDGNADAALAQLSLALRRYVLQTRSAPKSFEEFISQTKIQAPPPPAGQKYAIKSGAVVLINQ